MKAINITLFRKKLKKYLDYVSDGNGTIFIPRNNREEDAVVVISINVYNSLIETDYLLSTQANRLRLAESIQQVAEGQTISFDSSEPDSADKKKNGSDSE